MPRRLQLVGGKKLPPVSILPEHQSVDPSSYFIPRPEGGSAVVRATVPKEMVHRIAELVEGGGTDFKTSDDFARAAVYWFYRVIAEKVHGGAIYKDLELMTATMRAVQRADRITSMEQSVTAIAIALQKLVAKNMMGEAAKVLEEAEENFGALENASRRKVALDLLASHPTFKAIRAWVVRTGGGDDDGDGGE